MTKFNSNTTFKTRKDNITSQHNDIQYLEKITGVYDFISEQKLCLKKKQSELALFMF